MHILAYKDEGVPSEPLTRQSRTAKSENRITFMVNDAFGRSGLGSWKSQWKMYQTNRMTHIKGSILKRLNIEHSS